MNFYHISYITIIKLIHINTKQTFRYKINTLKINGYFYITDFNSLTSLIQKETIRHIFHNSNWGSTIWLSEANITEIIRFINWKNNKTKKEIKWLKMRKENKIIIF